MKPADATNEKDKAKADVVPANSIYDTWAPKPYRYIYMYYLKPDSPHHRQIEVYFIDQGRPTALTPTSAEDFANKADSGTISPIGWSIEDLRWRFDSYLLFVMRNVTKKFALRNAVVLTEAVSKGDHSFRDGVDILNPRDPKISGMWCINHRLNRHGGRLGVEEEEVFDVYFPGITDPRIHNESGSNTGP